ncbi:MAG: hypothetical protein JWL81_2501 [Verrucomicrobiales bacterium]|nr:hypothetical protein [Verrucomicrobiales bacterium]
MIPDPTRDAAPTTPKTKLLVPDETALDPITPVVPAGAGWWQKIGGGSLTVSIIIHAVLILLLVLIVRTVITPGKETVDFLPGGGGGGKGSNARIAEKKRAASISAPKTRIVSTAIGSVSLPDIQTSMSDFSSLSAAAPMGGGVGGGVGGISGSGSGGLTGNGRGTGFGPGSGSGFVSIPLIFGQKIDARRMAVVLDMSGSMYSFLPTVIKEVDKVAPGSMVILHYGCGLGDAEIKKPGIEATTSRDFSDDRIVTSLLGSATAAMNQQQREALLEMVKKRPKTFFVPSTGVGSTWVALTDPKLKDVDAIYWFADFADGLSADKMEDIAKKLRGRKQKLYIHPSNPKWLEGGDPLAVNVNKVENTIVKPTGGKVIKVDVKKEEPVKTDQKPPAKPA